MGKTIETSGDNEAFKLPTTGEIEKLKKEHGELSLITVINPKTKGEHFAIMRKPKMQDLQIASASEKKKAHTFNLSIWNNCKIVADPAIDNDDVLLMGACAQVNELVEIAEGSIKKL